MEYLYEVLRIRYGEKLEKIFENDWELNEIRGKFDSKLDALRMIPREDQETYRQCLLDIDDLYGDLLVRFEDLTIQLALSTNVLDILIRKLVNEPSNIITPEQVNFLITLLNNSFSKDSYDDNLLNK